MSTSNPTQGRGWSPQALAFAQRQQQGVNWEPNASPGDGFFTEFSEIAASVLVASPPTLTQVRGNPDEDLITIPGGTWNLAGNTICGTSQDAWTDTNYRGMEDLLYIVCNPDPDAPTWLKDIAGLKNTYFRATHYSWPDWLSLDLSGSDGTVSALDNMTVTFTKGNGTGHAFSQADVGKPVRIGNVSPYGGAPADDGNNEGTFIITAVIDEDTFQYSNCFANISDANNGSIGWDLCSAPIIVTSNEAPEIRLTNCDLYFGGNYNWGTIYIAPNADVTIRMEDGAGLHWYSVVNDGYAVIQTDGSPIRIGTSALSGNGTIDLFAQAGTEVDGSQQVDTLNLYQPTIPYTPNSSGDWDTGVPETHHAALDTLRADLVSARNTANAGIALTKVSVQITQAGDLAGQGAGIKSFSVNFSALPSHAMLVFARIDLTQAFGGTGTFSVKIGDAGGSTHDEISNGVDVKTTSSVTFPDVLSASWHTWKPWEDHGGATLALTITSNADLNTATQGDVTVDLYYLPLA